MTPDEKHLWYDFLKEHPQNFVRQKVFLRFLLFPQKRRNTLPPLRAVLLTLTRGQPHPPSQSDGPPSPSRGRLNEVRSPSISLHPRGIG